MTTSIYIDIKIGELYTSQCSAVTVCLTCDSEKDSSAHTQSVLFIFRGNNTICSWITKLYWLVVILSMVLSWAAYSAGRMSTCTDTVTDPVLPRHKHFKPVKPLSLISIKIKPASAKFNEHVRHVGNVWRGSSLGQCSHGTIQYPFLPNQICFKTSSLLLTHISKQLMNHSSCSI